MRRRVFYLDAEAEALLAKQAKAHGVSQGAIVRARIKGHRPGSEPGSAAAAADHWWDTRPPKRRVSIHRNKAGVKDDTGDHQGQATIFDQEGVA